MGAAADEKFPCNASVRLILDGESTESLPLIMNGLEFKFPEKIAN